MNKDKLKNYSENKAIHTLEVLTNNSNEVSENLENLKTVEVINQVFESVTETKKSEKIKIRLNINKVDYLSNKREKYIYNDFKKFKKIFNYIEDLILDNTKQNFNLQRCDICFDFYNPDDYIRFYKLHLFIISILGIKLNIPDQNTYNTNNLYKPTSKEIKISNDYLEFCYYDKQVQTNYNSLEPTARFEIRLKRLSHNSNFRDFTKLYEKIEKIFDEIIRDFAKLEDELIKKINGNLIDFYNEQKKYYKLNKLKTFKNDTEFIRQYSDLIFSSKQLQDLYTRLGYENSKDKAYKFKNQNKKLEYFTKNDLICFVNYIKKSLKEYFNID